MVCFMFSNFVLWVILFSETLCLTENSENKDHSSSPFTNTDTYWTNPLELTCSSLNISQVCPLDKIG